MFRGYIYRLVMIIAHKYNWHYAPPIYPENDVQLWCKWCGFRQTIKRGKYMDYSEIDNCTKSAGGSENE